MAISVYTPASDRIIHSTKINFTKRNVNEVVHLVQYDVRLPLLEVSLYYGDSIYTLPNTATSMTIRWPKKDGTYVISNVLGCDSTRTKVYVEVTQQMSYYCGSYMPILELNINNDIAGTSRIPIEIEPNPVPTSMVASSSNHPEVFLERYFQSIQGYDSNKTQILKHINGQFNWIDEN